jgi:hypothetical protein
MKGYITTRVATIALALVALAGLVGCEDSAPTDYLPQTVVEAFLIVGEPVHDIRVTRSQSVTDTFRYRNSAVADASVKLIAGDRTLQLVYRANEGVGEYYLPDTTVRIEPDTRYRVVVTMADGSVVSGETRTPAQISWIEPPDSLLYYPKDTIGLPAPDSLGLSWTAAPSISEYIISVRCLDTLGYGRYLDPPTSETNRRIERFFEQGAPFYDDVTRIGFLQGTSTPISWFAFKWFGPQEVTVFASDPAFVNWYKMTHFQDPATYQPLLGNVDGGLGVVASASVARQRVFLFKNQP